MFMNRIGKDIEHSTEIINQVCQSKDLLETADCLSQLIDFCKAMPGKTNSLTELSHMISRCIYLDDFNTKSRNTKLYKFFSGRDATLLFLDIYLDAPLRVEGLEELVNYIYQHFIITNEQRLRVEQVSRVLSLVEDRFPKVGRAFLRNPILFGFLDNTHKLCNSFYLCKIWFGRLIYDAIMLTNPLPDFGCSQEFTLLHELGHAVHTRLTRDAEIILQSFIELFWNVFYQYPESLKEAKELFADFFAFAAAMGTPLEEESPLFVLSFEKKNKIEWYFSQLFKKL